MPTLINLRPIQTGDSCYLTDHHNRPGECIITVMMTDGCTSDGDAADALVCEGRTLGVADTAAEYDASDLASVARWCAEQWRIAEADMPAATDRDTQGDDDARYLECHILATWGA